ncbi:MAG: glycosyltransferase family 2 protein [Candidatus Acidiferrales bacterium]
MTGAGWAENLATAVFWVCAFLIAYTYFFYPLVLFTAYAFSQVRRDWQYLTGRHNRRALTLPPDGLPAVSLIIPAYNEQEHLPEKIANIQQLDYPREKIEVVFISDGSTDGTNDILSATETFPVQNLFFSVRQGKSTALNEGVKRAQHDLLIMSDAATLFATDALKNLVRHFQDPRAGVVCGALLFKGSQESQQTEGVYWRYESMLRLMEARLGATMTASGAIYALRRDCFLPISADTVIEDFVIPMNARKRGYRVIYDPEVVATEFAASSVSGEFTRRVRLAVGSFRALRQLARARLRGFSLLAFVSHKVLRWTVPFLLIGLLVSNFALLGSLFYRCTLAAQLLFYAWAGAGFVFRERLKGVRFALLGYFLLSMNLAFLVGFYRFAAGRKEVTWQRVN